MKVNIKVGTAIAMDADNSGAAYNLYPVTVQGEHDKRLTRATLSVNGSGVAQSPGAKLDYQLSSRDYEPGSHKLFASVTDGDETATAESSISVSAPSAKAASPSSPPPATTSNPK